MINYHKASRNEPLAFCSAHGRTEWNKITKEASDSNGRRDDGVYDNNKQKVQKGFIVIFTSTELRNICTNAVKIGFHYLS